MTQRLNTFFKTSRELSLISGKVRQLRAYQQHYEQVAPPSLLRASHVEHIDNEILTLVANNGAIAAKLRQMAPELLRQLQLHGCEVTGIQVRVQVTLPSRNPEQQAPAISPHGKEELSAFAGSLPDSPLKNALQRLIGHKKNQ